MGGEVPGDHERAQEKEGQDIMTSELEKRNAAVAAMEFVEDGMTLGLGTGSTAKHFVELLAEEVDVTLL